MPWMAISATVISLSRMESACNPFFSIGMGRNPVPAGKAWAYWPDQMPFPRLYGLTINRFPEVEPWTLSDKLPLSGPVIQGIVESMGTMKSAKQGITDLGAIGKAVSKSF
jgi:hypothetical protein